MYKVANITATEWVIDFVKRLTQLRTLASDVNYKTHNLWIGGFFFPEALITATRQSVAENHGWSLEELDLVVKLGVSKLQDDQSFIIEGLNLEGYSWSQDIQDLIASASLSEKLPPVTLRWTRIGENDGKDLSNATQIPVYLNSERLNLLFSVKVISEQSRSDLYLRGIALVAWSS